MSRDPTPYSLLVEALTIARDGFGSHAPPTEIADGIDRLVKLRISQAVSALPIHVHGGVIRTEDLYANVQLAWDRGDEGYTDG